MGYVAQIEEVGLSSKGKSIKHFRGRNIQRIVKLGMYVGLKKIQILCEN